MKPPKAKRRRNNVKQDDFQEDSSYTLTSPEDRRAGSPDSKEQRIGDEDLFVEPTKTAPATMSLETPSTTVACRAAQELMTGAFALNEASVNLRDCRAQKRRRTSGTSLRPRFEAKDSYASDNGGDTLPGSRSIDSSNTKDNASSLGMLENKENLMVQVRTGPAVSCSGQMECCVDQEIEHMSHEKATNISNRRRPNPGPKLEVQDSELESSDDEEDTIPGDAEPESQWPADRLGLDVDARRCLQESSDDDSSDYIIGSDTQATVQDQERLLETICRKRDRRDAGDMWSNLAEERLVSIVQATDAFQDSDHHSAEAPRLPGLELTKSTTNRGDHHDHFGHIDLATKNGSDVAQDKIRPIGASSLRNNPSLQERGSRYLHSSREGEQRARSEYHPSSNPGPCENASNMVKSLPPTTPDTPICNRTLSPPPPPRDGIPPSVPVTPLPTISQAAESTKRDGHRGLFSALDPASMTQLLPESLMNEFLPMPPLTQESMGEARQLDQADTLY